MFELSTPIQRNLTMEELIRINEPWCATEILRRLRDDSNLVVDIDGWISEEDWELDTQSHYEMGVEAGKEEGEQEGECAGYKQGFQDSKDGKEFDEDYR